MHPSNRETCRVRALESSLEDDLIIVDQEEESDDFTGQWRTLCTDGLFNRLIEKRQAC
jgi:hypothetical protein